MIALVRHADDLVAEPEREEQLGRVGHEARRSASERHVMTLLSDDEVARPAGDDWRREGDEIVRDLEFEDFAAAMAYVNDVAAAAEEANHHPGHPRPRLEQGAADALTHPQRGRPHGRRPRDGAQASTA